VYDERPGVYVGPDRGLRSGLVTVRNRNPARSSGFAHDLLYSGRCGQLISWRLRRRVAGRRD
jgi:hypothetical protein